MTRENKLSRKEFIRSLIRYGIIVAMAVFIGYLIMNRDISSSSECSGVGKCEGCSKAVTCPGNK